MKLSDDMEVILKKHDAQIVCWRPVPQGSDELERFMRKAGISYLEEVIVKTLYDDGSGSVDTSMIIPESTKDGGYKPVWKMSDYAKLNNMIITHYMRFPKPPVGTENI